MSELKHTKMLMQYDEDEGGGGGMQMDLLWENASSSSSFSSQYIPLNLSDYKQISILFRISATNNMFTQIQTSMIVPNGSYDNIFVSIRDITYNLTSEVIRKVTLNTSSITFGSGTQISDGSAIDFPRGLVPYKIYGIK